MMIILKPLKYFGSLIVLKYIKPLLENVISLSIKNVESKSLKKK